MNTIVIIQTTQGRVGAIVGGTHEDRLCHGASFAFPENGTYDYIVPGLFPPPLHLLVSPHSSSSLILLFTTSTHSHYANIKAGQCNCKLRTRHLGWVTAAAAAVGLEERARQSPRNRRKCHPPRISRLSRPLSPCHPSPATSTSKTTTMTASHRCGRKTTWAALHPCKRQFYTP